MPHHPFALPPRSLRREILDLRPATPQEIKANFEEIARVNRFLGGTAAVRAALQSLFRHDSPGAVRLLDIASGGADIPRSLVATFRAGGFANVTTFHITATDLSPEILAYAGEMTPNSRYPEVEIARADALALPYPDAAFDYVTCSMALHHFDPPLAVQALREMARVCRRAVAINDLRRDRLSATLIFLLTRLLRAHPITQHDAPLSVLRAYTPGEVRELFARAVPEGNLTVRKARMFRFVAIFRPDG